MARQAGFRDEGAEESFPIVLLELLVEMVFTNLRVRDQSLLFIKRRTHVLFRPLSGFDKNAGNVDVGFFSPEDVLDGQFITQHLLFYLSNKTTKHNNTRDNTNDSTRRNNFEK